jgi:hypothetical protein
VFCQALRWLALLARSSAAKDAELPMLAEYADHYDRHRPHRALGQTPPLGPGESAVAVPAGRVARRDRLGGLIHQYAQVE